MPKKCDNCNLQYTVPCGSAVAVPPPVKPKEVTIGLPCVAWFFCGMCCLSAIGLAIAFPIVYLSESCSDTCSHLYNTTSESASSASLVLREMEGYAQWSSAWSVGSTCTCQNTTAVLAYVSVATICTLDTFSSASFCTGEHSVCHSRDGLLWVYLKMCVPQADFHSITDRDGFLTSFTPSGNILLGDDTMYCGNPPAMPPGYPYYQ